MKMMTYAHKFHDSPVGRLKLIASSKGLVAVLWENDRPKRVRLAEGEEEPGNPILTRAENELDDYFAGGLRNFTVSLDLQGTDFQIAVWKALLTIPFGETRSYRRIAMQIGRPEAVRAVGAAIGKNPISIVTPCHRVIGSDGSLTGFAGGLPTKEQLLGLEWRVAA